MGNLNNPNINRWGLNLFWYKLWYADYQNQLLVQLGKIIDEFVYSYIVYGIILYKNIFSNNYWWNTHKIISESNQYLKLDKYYRKMTFFNKQLEINSHYTLRIGLQHVFTTKVQIFRFQNWLIINFYYFQPLIKKIKKKLTKKNVYLASYSYSKTPTVFKTLKRLILLNLYRNSFLANKTVNYIF